MRKIFFIVILIIVISCSKKIERNIETTIMENTEHENVIIDPSDSYSTNVNIPFPDFPLEFEEKNWNSNFGSLSPIENISLEDLQSCSWQKNDTILIFSQEGHYARMGRDGYEYGSYLLENNIIFFNPPLNVIRFAEKYTVPSLYYSNEMYYEGTPVLKSDDETVVFSANDAKKARIGETVKLHQYYCEKTWEKSLTNTNGMLYSLPNTTSKNIFHESYYGKKATQAKVIKLAKTSINDEVWYYTLFDFTSDDPVDGGGPFYNGWLPEEYLE